jgi:hypothetical protein
MHIQFFTAAISTCTCTSTYELLRLHGGGRPFPNLKHIICLYFEVSLRETMISATFKKKIQIFKNKSSLVFFKF